MSTQEQNEIYIALLARQLSEELSDEELFRLNSWINASADNALLAEQIRNVWEQSAEWPAAPVLDVELDYKQVLDRIRIQQPVSTGKIRPIHASPVSLWLRVAAGLLFLLAAYWGYNAWKGGAPPGQIVEASGPGETQLVQLPDGSRVWLRRQARLEFPPQFEDNKRTVKLAGQAYFEVEHRADQPFQVETVQGDQIQVLGTSFSVFSNAENAEVFVNAGQVKFMPAGVKESLKLAAMEKGVFKRSVRRLSKSDINNPNELAWKQGGLVFNNTPLHQVAKDMETYFNIKIDLTDSEMRVCPVTSPLPQPSLQALLNSLHSSHNIEIEQKDSVTYIWKGGYCRDNNQTAH